jgi:hypothetical protein
VLVLSHLALALGHASAEAVHATRAQVQQAREKTAESFDQLVRDHSSRHLAPELASFMLAAADMGYVARDCVDGLQRVDSQGAALIASWFMLAERIEGVRAARTVPLHREELRAVALVCLGGWRGESSQRGKAALGLAWTHDWLQQLDTLVRDLEEPAAKVAAGGAAPWWK